MATVTTCWDLLWNTSFLMTMDHKTWQTITTVLPLDSVKNQTKLSVLAPPPCLLRTVALFPTPLMLLHNSSVFRLQRNQICFSKSESTLSTLLFARWGQIRFACLDVTNVSSWVWRQYVYFGDFGDAKI